MIDGKYVKYGINDDGVISYTAEDFSRDICDESIGSLYSYDESKYLFESDLGEYVNISGESLFGTIDYDALEAEVNSCVTFLVSSVRCDIVTMVNHSDAVLHLIL